MIHCLEWDGTVTPVGLLLTLTLPYPTLQGIRRISDSQAVSEYIRNKVEFFLIYCELFSFWYCLGTVYREYSLTVRGLHCNAFLHFIHHLLSRRHPKWDISNSVCFCLSNCNALPRKASGRCCTSVTEICRHDWSQWPFSRRACEIFFRWSMRWSTLHSERRLSLYLDSKDITLLRITTTNRIWTYFDEINK